MWKEVRRINTGDVARVTGERNFAGVGEPASRWFSRSLKIRERGILSREWTRDTVNGGRSRVVVVPFPWAVRRVARRDAASELNATLGVHQGGCCAEDRLGSSPYSAREREGTGRVG